MIKRELQNIIKEKLFSEKSIIILGARQVGKTTLLKLISEEYTGDIIWLNADNPDDRSLLDNINGTRAKELFSNELLIIDEAQRLENSGLTLKIIHDNCKPVQLIATGSSSFELTDKIKESLTGRKWTFSLYPFSASELINHTNKIDFLRSLETRIIFGSYPDIINTAGNENELLSELISDYLYKDVFTLKEIRKPELLDKLVKAIAYQIGHQVSYRELSVLLKADKETIERYINLLEEAYIIFKLPSYSANLRNELKKSKKIYFIDTGVRNAVINQFQPFSLRNDIGPLWENYMISERLKYLNNNRISANSYFWRTNRQQEIDYIEESAGKLSAYEFKWGEGKKYRFPKTFTEGYPGSELAIINRDNFLKFVN